MSNFGVGAQKGISAMEAKRTPTAKAVAGAVEVMQLGPRLPATAFHVRDPGNVDLKTRELLSTCIEDICFCHI